MKKITMTIDEMNAAIAAAVNAAIDAREAKRNTTLVSRKACAHRLKVDPSTLWRWNRDGYLRAIKIAGRIWYTEDSIRQIERGERGA